jgi:hypothetical protein
MPRRAIVALGAVACVAMAASTLVLDTAGAAKPDVIRVPQDESTIQDAVEASKAGTLVLVAPGVYHEAVTVTPEHARIVIRGVDRATTIVDGGFDEEPGHESGFRVLADGVAIENLTARNFAENGFLWAGVDGYRGSYLTAIRNGIYGIAASASVHGQLDHSYASGSPDAGFFIASCFPCDALITDSEAEWNGFGFAGTNAGGGLVVARSSWHDNRAGIVPNSRTSEADPPERRTTIVGNLVVDNNNAAAGAVELAETAIGNGILIAGGSQNEIARNRVTGHDVSGIAAIPLPETVLTPGNPEARDFDARDNTVRDNVTTDNRYDLLSVTNVVDASDAGGNCFADNVYTTSSPADVEQVLPCGRPTAGFVADLALFVSLLAGDKPAGGDSATVELPATQRLRGMRNPKTARARPASNEPSIAIKVRALDVPQASTR